MKRFETPISEGVIRSLDVGSSILLSGWIFTGRDAALPKLVRLIESGGLEKAGAMRALLEELDTVAAVHGKTLYRQEIFKNA